MRNIWSVVLLAAAMAIPGCTMYRRGGTGLSVNPKLPAAQSSVKYSATKNDNTRIVLTVKHLAQPEKLIPPASVYVVWTRDTRDGSTQNIGALKVDKDLNGELDAETPLHSFDLFITAEASGQVQQSTGPSLLWTNYSR